MSQTLPQTYCRLLYSLKSTVEGLLVHQIHNVWDIYGGLNRLFQAIEKIIKHDFNIFNQKGEADIWVFLENYIKTHEDVTRDNSCTIHQYLPPSLSSDKALLWIYKSLETHTLSNKLIWLTSNKQHLNYCYKSTAYLQQQVYVSAVIICLQAVELNQTSLLTEIHPSLYIIDWNQTTFPKTHRRCSSLPDHNKLDLELPSYSRSRFVRSNSDVERRVVTSISTHTSGNIPQQRTKLEVCNVRRKRFNSLPCLCNERTHRVRSNTSLEFNCYEQNVSQKEMIEKLLVDYEKLQEKCKNKKLRPRRRCKQRINISTIPESSPNENLDEDTDDSSVMSGKKINRKKTFMEDGGNSVLPMSIGYFPRPALGQSLASFLTSSQFSRTTAELDRENAHFSISEAMIAAIEQVKCNRQLRLFEDVAEESDEEINTLKQRIRLRRREKRVEKQRNLWSLNLLSDGKTDTATTTTEPSISPLSTSPESPSGSVSTDGVDDLDMDQVTNLHNTTLSMSMASLYSEAELFAHKTRKLVEVSAENVALSLLKQFKEKQLPRASDLEWLVSEEDAPQELLPMPKSWPVSPDESEDRDSSSATQLRGTTEWAPPRPQLIFTPHPPPNRKLLLAKQNSRCSGCGLKVAPEYAHRFRYCEYLGRYFCTGCHSNKLALIPGRVIMKWDFTRYPVSTFAYQLIDQMYTDPLFQIHDLNPYLFKKVKHLEKCRKWRVQLFYLKDFLMSCRFCAELQDEIQNEPSYILTNADVYSLQDLVLVKNGEMTNRLRDLVNEACDHVTKCQLCQAHGFICEICNNNTVIFPWQIDKVIRCTKCGTCFHLSCFKSGFCSRCLRFEARRKSRQEDDIH